MFAGSNEGAENWASVASLIETCKLNGVDPQRYFTDLLTRLVNGWPQARIDELMPWCWADTKKPPDVKAEYSGPLNSAYSSASWSAIPTDFFGGGVCEARRC